MNLSRPPDWLDRTGKLYFNKVVPTLQGLGKLDPLTYDLIAAASHAYSTYREAVETMKTEGRVITHPTSGVRKTHPALMVEKQAFEMLVKVWKELDLKGKPPILQADELDDFINEGK